MLLHLSEMPAFLYRCPSTGMNVQGWVAGDPTEHDDHSYEAVTCLACGQVHLVNPKTGKVIGEVEDGSVASVDRPRAGTSQKAWQG